MKKIGTFSPDGLTDQLVKWGCSEEAARRLTEILNNEVEAITILLHGHAREKGKPSVDAAHSAQMLEALKSIDALESAFFPPNGDNGLEVRLGASLDLDSVRRFREKIEEKLQQISPSKRGRPDKSEERRLGLSILATSVVAAGVPAEEVMEVVAKLAPEFGGAESKWRSAARQGEIAEAVAAVLAAALKLDEKTKKFVATE